MRPRRLVLENIHSFRGRHEIDLSGVSLAVLSGQNGAGKSTLAADSLLYALFGEARGNADTIVTEGEQIGRVEFEFSLNGDTYMVSRQRSTKGSGKTTTAFHKLTEDGPVVLDGKSERETQEKIEQVLCMTADLLRQTAFSTQGNAAAFADAKPADRKQVLASILNLDAWERKAETARAMARNAQAEAEGLERQVYDLDAYAAQVPALESQIAEVTERQADAAKRQEVAEANVRNLQADREELLTKQTQDQAARKELTDLQGRESGVKAEYQAATQRAEQLRTRVALRLEAEAALATARQAQAESDRLEGLRQEAQRLDQAVLLAESKVNTAHTQHRGDLAALDALVKSKRTAHEREASILTDQIADRRKQTAVLDTVPCAATGATAMVEQCPLIAQAREAQTALPMMEVALEALQAEIPWADDETKATALRAITPGEAEAAALEALRADRALVQYDPAAHAKAKTDAATLETWLGRLHQVEEAEAQLPEAFSAEQARRAELNELTARIAELTAALGAEADWATLLRDNATFAAEKQRMVACYRTDLEQCLSDLGGLRSRLEAAQEAAGRIEPLREQVGKLVRRRQLLTILGSPRDGAFSKGGIPALLIEQAIPALQDAANEVLETLSDGRMSLELRTQRQVAKGLAETLDLVVSDERGPRLYESFSGGERMRVDLALRVGLSEMLAARAGARCELLVLDETCAPLDQQGQAQFVECLARVADRFATVLVVTHLGDLKDAFPTCIQVTKNGDGSRVEVTTR